MNKAFPSEKKPPFAVFLSTAVIIFVLSLSAADSVGLVPDYIDGTAAENDPASQVLAVSNLPELGEEIATPVVEPEASTAPTTKPSRISIPAINLDLPVQNPETRDVDTLYSLLQKGPARYVDSAELGERGNVIIFAHSSNLPVVRNQMYKAFNRISELTAGDTITVLGVDGKKYLYSVDSVRSVNANDATIDLSPSIGTRLTLVTCDTLTSKSSRFILEADFIGAIDV